MMKASAQLFCAICLLLTAQGVGAEIYKCVDKKGATMLSNLPCSSSQKPADDSEKTSAITEKPAAGQALTNPLAVSAAESPKSLNRAFVEDMFT
ncbi:MAG: DUF4124 domain-containing protein, partial [Zoogloeaceae bacterium]|nr:DUF4124 domain-containing protein [Zoogloeaceae bacterium]